MVFTYYLVIAVQCDRYTNIVTLHRTYNLSLVVILLIARLAILVFLGDLGFLLLLCYCYCYFCSLIIKSRSLVALLILILFFVLLLKLC